MALDLASLDQAICELLRTEVPTLTEVLTLNSEDELESDKTPAPCAYVLIRGGSFKPSPGAARYQEGQADVLVWIKARSVGVDRGAAKQGEAGAYALTSAVINALNFKSPNGCCLLQLASFGVYRLSDRYKAMFAVQFSLNLEIDDDGQ